MISCVYRKNYSCKSVLVKMVDDCKVLLDNNHIIGVMFMDLSKAFECLYRGLLTAKLRAYGLSEHASDLIASYLSNRYQRVKIQNSRSDWRVLRKGVPQGSILGPLLFNVFVNDMFHFIEKCALYNNSDDNSMSYASLNVKDVLSCLKRDCDNAVKWFEINGMQADPSKFRFMVMSNGSVDKECISLSVNESILKPESHVKVLLGVTLDDRLTLTEHISICCSKATRQLNAISRISRYLDFSSCSFLLIVFVKCNFNYCPLVWHFCGKVNKEKIEKIQQRVLKIIYKNHVSSWYQKHMSPWCLIDDFMEFSLRFSNLLKESIRNVLMICAMSNQRLIHCETIFVLYNPKENNQYIHRFKNSVLPRCQVVEWQLGTVCRYNRWVIFVHSNHL